MGSIALLIAYSLYALFLAALGGGMAWLGWHLLTDDDSPRSPARRRR
jgi:hypothetical protein